MTLLLISVFQYSFFFKPHKHVCAHTHTLIFKYAPTLLCLYSLGLLFKPHLSASVWELAKKNEEADSLRTFFIEESDNFTEKLVIATLGIK